MSLTSKITEYDPRWRQQFETEATRLRPVFGESLIAICHVGSTSVDGLVAKPEIDILIVTAVQALSIDWSSGLRMFGYRRGGDLSKGHQFYKRDVAGIRTRKLHVCIAEHEQIRLMLDFRDELRRNNRLRDEYGSLKLYLERTNADGIGEYLDKKAPFIESILQSVRVQENQING